MRRKNGLGFTINKKYGIGIPLLLKKNERTELIKELNLIEKTDITNILEFQYSKEKKIIYSRVKPWFYIYPWQLKGLEIDFEKPFELKCFGLVSKREKNFIIYIKGECDMKLKDIFLKLVDVDNYCFIEIDVEEKKTSLYGFRDTRLNKEELALAKENGFYLYDLRTSDLDDSMPYSIEKDVLVNYYGTIITPKKIEEVEKGNDIVIKDYGLFDYSFIDEKIDEALEV